MSAMANFLDSSVLRAINQPVADTRVLSREAYTDLAFLALEREHVFDASWVFAGGRGEHP